MVLLFIFLHLGAASSSSSSGAASSSSSSAAPSSSVKPGMMPKPLIEYLVTKVKAGPVHSFHDIARGSYEQSPDTELKDGFVYPERKRQLGESFPPFDNLSEDTPPDFLMGVLSDTANLAFEIDQLQKAVVGKSESEMQRYVAEWTQAHECWKEDHGLGTHEFISLSIHFRKCFSLDQINTLREFPSARNQIFHSHDAISHNARIASRRLAFGRVFMDKVLQKQIFKFGASLYTIQGERGGTYKGINFDFYEHAEGRRSKWVPRSTDGLFEPFKTAHMMPEKIRDFHHIRELVTISFGYLYRFGGTDFQVHAPLILFRGVTAMNDENGKDMFETFQPGYSFYWPTFLSTTTNQSVAREFMKKHESHSEVAPSSILFKIEFPKGCYAIKLSSISAYPKEEEILLFPYHLFKVIKNEGRGLVHMVCLPWKEG